MLDLLLANGTVVFGGPRAGTHLGISGGRVAGLWRGGVPEARRVVDVGGRWVLPGIVDVHVHCRGLSTVYSGLADDVESVTRVAAQGGVTTVVLFMAGHREQRFRDAVLDFLEHAAPQAHVDFSLHCGLRPDFELLRDLSEVVDLGVTSFKMLLAYRRTSDGRMFATDHLFDAMRRIADCGGLALVHAEDGYVIDRLEAELRTGAGGDPTAYERSRPAFAEALAVSQAVHLAAATACPTYIVHLSTAQGLAAIREARGRGLSVFTETCPHYLALTREDFLRRPAVLRVAPPLRTGQDQDELWRGLADGTIEAVSSDHAPAPLGAKTSSASPVEGPVGLPGVETLLPLTYTRGVVGGRIDMARLVEVLCANPARRFGLYPAKGSLEPGADADVVVFDPEPERALSLEDLHGDYGYSPFEGHLVRGRVEQVYLRGQLIVSQGRTLSQPGQGRFRSQAAAGAEGVPSGPAGEMPGAGSATLLEGDG